MWHVAYASNTEQTTQCKLELIERINWLVASINLAKALTNKSNKRDLWTEFWKFIILWDPWEQVQAYRWTSTQSLCIKCKPILGGLQFIFVFIFCIYISLWCILIDNHPHIKNHSTKIDAKISSSRQVFRVAVCTWDGIEVRTRRCRRSREMETAGENESRSARRQTTNTQK